MTELIWTVVLVAVGVLGLWLAPKSWHGWAICAASEILWIIYALTIGSWALAAMAVVWGVVNTRNALLTYRARRREVSVPNGVIYCHIPTTPEEAWLIQQAWTAERNRQSIADAMGRT